MAGTPPSAHGTSHLVDLSARVSRHSALYAIGSGVGLVLALVNAIVLTQYLSPAEFGQLALLFLFAALLTIAYNTPFLPGSIMRTFGVTDEDGDASATGSTSALDHRRVLGTGIVLTAAAGVLGTVAVLMLGDAIPAMVGVTAPDAANLLLLAAVAGALGALWRLMTQVLRMERRPLAYVLLSTVRPVFVLAAVWSLVASGQGLRGAIVGTAGATALALIVAAVVLRNSFRLAFERKEVRTIVTTSVTLAPVIAGFWVLQNVDLFILARFVVESDVGIYRLASRIAAVASYISAAVFMAWTPLELTPGLKALDQARGRETLRASLTTYYIVIMGGVLLSLALLADALVRIAPPAYAAAAPLVPVIGLAFVMQGVFVAVFRSSNFPRRGMIYRLLVLCCALVFIPLCIGFSIWLGTVGAALAITSALGLGAATLWTLSQRGPQPVPFQYARLAGVVGTALGCYGLARVLGELLPGSSVGPDVLGLALYPVAVVALRVIPRDHLDPLAAMVRAVVSRGTDRETIDCRLSELADDERSALIAVADSARHRTEDQMRAATTALGKLAHVPIEQAHDELAARYLFAGLPEAERNSIAARLYDCGVTPDDLARLEQWRERVRRNARRLALSTGNVPAP